MNLIIGGHIRSGTSLLWRICNSHPDILLTLEFRCYYSYRKHYLKNIREILRGAWLGEFGDYIHGGQRKWNGTLRKVLFASRYLIELGKINPGIINGSDIDLALRRCLPETRIVGDKFPNYVYKLDQLTEIQNLSILMIYRDPRDVVSSTLIMVNKLDRAWTSYYNDAEKISRRWLRIMELMEQHASSIFCIQYENLVNRPKEIISDLGKFLGVDASGFALDLVHKRSLNKHRKNLSKEDLDIVMRIAGPTMARYGYK